MKKIDKIKRKINNYLFDHYVLNSFLKTLKQLFFCLASSFVFAFGFCSFVTPADVGGFTIVTGGVSGVSQNIALIIKIATGLDFGGNTIQSIAYFIINLPLLIFSFVKIGRRFSIFTLINVLLSSLFISLFSMEGSIGPMIAANELIKNSIISRVLLSGVFVGLSSAIAFRGDISSGGIDIVSYYFAQRKSTSVGKYAVMINAFIVTLYSILLIIKDPTNYVDGIVCILYSIIYLFLVSMVVDTINLRNKKVQLQFISVNPDLGKVLIANFPHGATQIDGAGVYSGAQKYVYYMVVSSNEVNKVVELAKKVDMHVFISVTPLTQVYGKFFIKPIE